MSVVRENRQAAVIPRRLQELDEVFIKLEAKKKDEEKVPVTYSLECRSCGYEPENAESVPDVCPKCNSRSWERYAQGRGAVRLRK